MTMVLIITGALGTITKGLVKGPEDLEMKGQVETIQTTALVRSDRILRRVRKTLEDLLSFKLHEKPSANAGVKKKQTQE